MRPIDAVALADVLNNLWVATSPSKYDDKETAFERAAMCRGIDDCIKYVHDSPTIGGWISVKDRLPEEETEYLCWFGNYPMGPFAWICRWNKIKGAFWCYSDDAKWPFVTHWMPMPEPPKGVKP